MPCICKNLQVLGARLQALLERILDAVFAFVYRFAPAGWPHHLFGIDRWLDQQLRKLASCALQNQHHHPGSAGDVSLLLPRRLGERLVRRFRCTASPYQLFARWHDIAHMRRDGRHGYCGEGVRDHRFARIVRELKGRVLIITATDQSIPLIKDDIAEGFGGRGIVVLQVSPSGDGIRILYGNGQFGTLPSSETLVHVAALAVMAQQGYEKAAVVHCHPSPLVNLASHPKLRAGEGCDKSKLNAALYRRQSLLHQGQEQTPTVVPVPYHDPGSEALVSATLDALSTTTIVLWERHGTVVLAPTVAAGYCMTASLSCAAEAGLLSLDKGHGGLPMSPDVRQAHERKGLVQAYEELFADIDHPVSQSSQNSAVVSSILGEKCLSGYSAS